MLSKLWVVLLAVSSVCGDTAMLIVVRDFEGTGEDAKPVDKLLITRFDGFDEGTNEHLHTVLHVKTFPARTNTHPRERYSEVQFFKQEGKDDKKKTPLPVYTVYQDLPEELHVMTTGDGAPFAKQTKVEYDRKYSKRINGCSRTLFDTVSETWFVANVDLSRLYFDEKDGKLVVTLKDKPDSKYQSQIAEAAKMYKPCAYAAKPEHLSVWDRRDLSKHIKSERGFTYFGQASRVKKLQKVVHNTSRFKYCGVVFSRQYKVVYDYFDMYGRPEPNAVLYTDVYVNNMLTSHQVNAFEKAKSATMVLSVGAIWCEILSVESSYGDVTLYDKKAKRLVVRVTCREPNGQEPKKVVV